MYGSTTGYEERQKNMIEDVKDSSPVQIFEFFFDDKLLKQVFMPHKK